MPILGLVLTLTDAEDSTRHGVLAAVGKDADLELGERAGHRWPAVLDAADERAAEGRIEALHGVPGVAHVDVVYADFEDRVQPTSLSAMHEEP